MRRNGGCYLLRAVFAWCEMSEWEQFVFWRDWPAQASADPNP